MKNTVIKQLTFPKEMVATIEGRAKSFGYDFAEYVRFILAKDMEKELDNGYLSPELLRDIEESYEDYKNGNYTTLRSRKDIKKYMKSLLEDEE
jgi:hypothetical protein